MGKTLLDKTWDHHVVADLAGGYQLLHVDRHLVHDLSGPAALQELRQRGVQMRSPELAFATPDHCVSTAPGRTDGSTATGRQLIPVLRAEAFSNGMRLFDIDSPEQGIVHVIGPELGLTLPGLTILCGDSHTCTHGALGALAWGIGSSEVVHVMATACIIDKKPLPLRVRFEGSPAPGVTAKDLALYLLGRHGTAFGAGHAIEFAGSAVRAMGIEARMTICNLSIEMGARIGQVAPDDATFDYLAGRAYAPRGTAWEKAVGAWRALPSDEDAVFDDEIVVDAGAVEPQISWGTNPGHTIDVGSRVPDPSRAPDAVTREGWQAALDYMGLESGQPIAGTPVDHIFIGSCTNSRVSDLQAAADVVKGRHVASGVTAWVVPGSQEVRRDAEALGLDRVFRDAGFEWRLPGCSMCLATNGEVVGPGQRCVSTSNRNFVGRQGPGARTHLASPAMAAAAAVIGRITDVRTLARG